MYGIADGPVASATFLLPAGVAFGKRGEVYVADQSAERIRMIAGGVVTTIAGSGDLPPGARHVDGGYVDGPATKAKFNEPNGIAVSPNGDIFVSDEGNRRIRKISAGVVTTVAGTDGPAADGPVASAAFASPHGLAFDDDGTLYVADFGVGIRRVSNTGAITTIAKETLGDQHFVGITAFGRGANATVYATTNQGAFDVISPATGALTRYPNGDIEGPGSMPLLYGIAHLDDDQFLATDVHSSAIRLYRLPQRPFVNEVSGPVVAGRAFEEQSEAAGDVDGRYATARFYDPFGIAVLGNRVVIADSGNRTVREMRLPDTRRSIGIDVKELARTSDAYRVLYVGASDNFWATAWSDSIAGTLEQRLNGERASLGIPRTVAVETVRIDSATVAQMADFIEANVPPHAFDLIVVAGGVSNVTQGISAPGVSLEESGGAIVSALQKRLGAGTPVLAFGYPTCKAASLVDCFVQLQNVAEDSSRSVGTDNVLIYQRRQFATFAKAASPALVYDAFDDVLALETAPHPPELWPIGDSHESLEGRRVLANLLFKELKRLHPWKS